MIKKSNLLYRLVSLSPLSVMALKFHLSFKAELLSVIEKTQNLKSFLEKNNNKVNMLFGDINTKNQK